MKTADDCRYLLSTILHPRLSAPGAVCVFNNRSGLALVQLMSSVRASARRLTATSTSNQMTTHRYQYASAPSDRARWGSQSKANADVRLRRPRPPHAGERQQSYKGNDVRRRVYARGRHRDGDSPFAMHAPFESRVLTRQCRALSERNFKVNHAHRAPTERVRRYVGRLSGPDNGAVLVKFCSIRVFSLALSMAVRYPQQLPAFKPSKTKRTLRARAETRTSYRRNGLDDSFESH